MGGFNGSLRVRTVDVYDGVKDQWTSIASMQERRSTLGAAVLNDLLYAVGGFDGSTGRSGMWPPLLPAWDKPSVQPWFAQPVLGPTFSPSIAPSLVAYSFYLIYLACPSQAFLHTEYITAHMLSFLGLWEGSCTQKRSFSPLYCLGTHFFKTRLRKRTYSASGHLRTV